MKKIPFALLALALLAVSACGASRQSTPMIEVSDLLHHRFIIESVNGVPFTSEFRTPAIEFNEGMLLTGQICNNFRGKGVLKDGVLTMDQAAATMMLCPDPALNDLERSLFKMLHEGVNIQREGEKLTLQRDDKTLVFTLRDYVS
ncbi:META domain-containing protein [Desulfovibrio sp. OttesenSCG-928-I05]|nr:META domain-containing protein [Desulfovibrio sp. OttesenSCG-928-I05]